jgi:hypothetical protein
MGDASYNLAEVCRRLGKAPAYLRHVQSALGLHVPKDGEGYSDAYVCFLQTVVALRTLGIPTDDIADLFDTEKKLLHLLRIDTLTHSPTWYLDQCGRPSVRENCLLLTNVDLGGAIGSGGVQIHLDFGQRKPELFSGSEMGEDARRILAAYLDKLDTLRDRARAEEPALRAALQWSRRNLN